MEDNLEVYFCEICSESIPLKDLETRIARQVKGKVIGACCLPELAPRADKTGASPASLTALGVVFLAGLAAATIWLEYRLTTTAGELDGRLNTISTSVGTQNERWGSLEGQLEKFADKAGQSSISSRLGQLEGSLASIKADLDQLGQGHADTKAGLGKLDLELGAVKDQGEQASSNLQAVGKEVQQLSRDVAALAALPRGASKLPGKEADLMEPEPIVKEAARKDGLPPNLAHQVARLKDRDAGNRFEAVDQLIQSKDPRVREHLLPMLKDEDLFVRRLTAEGLSNFKDATAVDALIVALADPEGIVRHTAYTSLKKLTGQKIPFDPEGSGSARNAAQRKWKDWWSKARSTF
jgi:HEAT repeats